MPISSGAGGVNSESPPLLTGHLVLVEAGKKQIFPVRRKNCRLPLRRGPDFAAHRRPASHGTGGQAFLSHGIDIAVASRQGQTILTGGKQ